MNSLLTIIGVVFSSFLIAQTTCSELQKQIESSLDGESYTVLDSDFLTSVTGYYHQESDTYFVVTTIDFTDTYIYCGVSSYNWSQFRLEAFGDQVGETWHRVIKPYKCDCY